MSLWPGKSMLARAFGLIVAASVVWCCSVSGTSAAGDQQGPVPMGAGGFPITSVHASAWFAHRADKEGQAVTLMVFFEGTPGWHDKTTDFNWVIKGIPATIDMNVGSTPIHLKYWSSTGIVQVMGQDFKLSNHNVFLVSGVDSKAPGVKALGTHDLMFAEADLPPVALLKRNQPVLSVLLGEENIVDAAAKSVSNAPADLIAMDQQGLVLIMKGTAEDDRRAFELFQEAAAKGYAPSQYRLGVSYGAGRGVKEDLALANQWYLKAAEQGYMDAQYKLAHSYRVGRGVAIDLAAAIHWYTRAADSGDKEAQYNLGMMYSTGLGSEVNLPKALEWYTKAAENDSGAAQYELAKRYHDGDGVAKDLTSAYTWLLILRSHRKEIGPDDWKAIDSLLASVTATITDEAKTAGDAKATEILGSQARRYLKSLRRAGS